MSFNLCFDLNIFDDFLDVNSVGERDFDDQYLSTEFKKPEEFEIVMGDFNFNRYDLGIHHVFEHKTFDPSMDKVQLDNQEQKKTSIKATSLSPVKSEKKVGKGFSKVDRDLIVDQERLWTVPYANSEIFSNARLNKDITVKVKSRSTTSSIQLDESMYSSIKYEMSISIQGNCLRGYNLPEVFLANIRVLDNENNFDMDEYLGEPSLTTPNQATLSTTENGFEGKVRLTLNNKLSFHKTKKEFILQIDLHYPNDLQYSILTLNSPPFKCFCRKPDSVLTKRRKTSKKRTRQTDGLSFRVTKRGKIGDFKQRLHDLLCLVKNLPSEVQGECYEKIYSQLALEMDQE